MDKCGRVEDLTRVAELFRGIEQVMVYCEYVLTGVNVRTLTMTNKSY